MKYTVEFKLECVNKYKNGIHINYPFGHSKSSFLTQVREWTKKYEDLGIDGLKHSSSNKEWTVEQRFELVAKVLAGNSINYVSLNAHINPGQLYNWVNRYRKKGMEGLECKRGRRPNYIMGSKKKTKITQSEKEELKLLRERNEYLEIENEYLKKLDALVSKREAAHSKAKKQK